MSRDGSGNYSLPAGNPVVTDTTISSTTHNSTMTDIATALTASLTKNGEAVITGNIDYNGNIIILDVDGDTTLGASSDDKLDIKIGGMTTSIEGEGIQGQADVLLATRVFGN